MISTKAFYFVLAVALCSATIVVADASSSSRVLQDSCQTICQGAAMNGGDKLLPIFTGDAQTCDAVEALLTSQDSTACTVVSGYLQFLDLAAYCECDGSGLPGVCAAPCTVDQGAADVDFQVPLLNATFTCSQAEIFAAYLTSDFACTGYTALFNNVCCSTSPGTPTASTTGSPAASPTTDMPVPVVSPTPATGMPVMVPVVPTESSDMPSSSPSEMPVPLIETPTIDEKPTAPPISGGAGGPTPPAPSPPSSGPTSSAGAARGGTTCAIFFSWIAGAAFVAAASGFGVEGGL